MGFHRDRTAGNHTVRATRALGVCLLTLAMGVLAGCGPGKPPAATVHIASLPEEGAMVNIGGITYGVTPLTVNTLTPGQHYIVLTRDGYKRATKAISLEDDEEITLSFELVPTVGYVTIESNPPRAEVYLDDANFIGETPIVNHPFLVGTHSYELRLEDHVTLTREIAVEEDYRYTYTHEIEPMDGQLQILSRPSSAQIWINDELQDKATPARLKMSPGVYTVGVYEKGYVMSERAVTLEPNAQQTVDFVLKEGDMPAGMVLIPAGEFLFGVNEGAPDERPQRQVFVDAFYIDKNEVTNEEFAQVFPAHTFESIYASTPVRGVTWSQAAGYAEAVGKRLAREDEWEKAARGTDGREYPWGNRFDPELCNAYVDAKSAPKKAGLYRGGASPYGVLDMAGNVYEWTSGWYNPYEGNTDINTEYGNVFRVLRGGSYASSPYELRSAKRHYDRPDNAREDYGFRCAQDIQESAPKGARSN